MIQTVADSCPKLRAAVLAIIHRDVFKNSKSVISILS
jgi:hypothetical protein